MRSAAASVSVPASFCSVLTGPPRFIQQFVFCMWEKAGPLVEPYRVWEVDNESSDFINIGIVLVLFAFFPALPFGARGDQSAEVSPKLPRPGRKCAL